MIYARKKHRKIPVLIDRGKNRLCVFVILKNYLPCAIFTLNPLIFLAILKTGAKVLHFFDMCKSSLHFVRNYLNPIVINIHIKPSCMLLQFYKSIPSVYPKIFITIVIHYCCCKMILIKRSNGFHKIG